MIKVLIVDDSLVLGKLLEAVINHQDDLTVVGVATSGAEGVLLADQLKPDVITMDIQMPGMDGFDTISAILERRPVPIVVVSALVDDEAMAINFRAYELGAVAVERKPTGYSSENSEAGWTSLLQSIRAMHGVRPISPKRGTISSSSRNFVLQPHVLDAAVIAIGSSTGGPQVLQQILQALPRDYDCPVLVVQHLTPGFMPGMRTWLQGFCSLPITIAQNGEKLLPGRVYLGSDNQHLTVFRQAGNAVIKLTDSAPVELFRPSVTVLFESVAEQFGPHAVGVLLTGMGRDGAVGMARMRKAGARTIVQDQASSVVYGMPGEALKLDAVEQVMTPTEIAKFLGQIAPAAARSSSRTGYTNARTDH